MKKRIIIYLVGVLLIFFAVSAVIFNFNKDTDDLVDITVAEVAHTIFYAPQYVALENGYFEEVGIDVELILTSGVKSQSVISFNCY